MIYGLTKWDDPNTYWSQTNNPTEQILKKDGLRDSEKLREIGKKYGIKDSIINEMIKSISMWLESCGNTTAVNIADALGADVEFLGPGPWAPKADECLLDYFNSPENYDKFIKIRNDIDPDNLLGNEVPQYYVAGIPDVLNIPCGFFWGAYFDKMVQGIKKGKGLMICLKDPGHYVGIVAYDDETDELIYRDPWPGNYWPERHLGTPGFNRRMNREDFKNVQSFYLVIG